MCLGNTILMNFNILASSVGILSKAQPIIQRVSSSPSTHLRLHFHIPPATLEDTTSHKPHSIQKKVAKTHASRPHHPSFPSLSRETGQMHPLRTSVGYSSHRLQAKSSTSTLSAPNDGYLLPCIWHARSLHSGEILGSICGMELRPVLLTTHIPPSELEFVVALQANSWHTQAICDSLDSDKLISLIVLPPLIFCLRPPFEHSALGMQAT